MTHGPTHVKIISTPILHGIHRVFKLMDIHTYSYKFYVSNKIKKKPVIPQYVHQLLTNNNLLQQFKNNSIYVTEHT